MTESEGSARTRTGEFYHHLNACIAANNRSDWAAVWESSGPCFEIANAGSATIAPRHLSTLVQCCVFAGRRREIVALADATNTREREIALRQLTNELIGRHNRSETVAISGMIETILADYGALLAASGLQDLGTAVWKVALARWNDPRIEILERLISFSGAPTRPPLSYWDNPKRRVYPEIDCIFVHIPRTAGHSVADGLFREATTRDLPASWAELGNEVNRLEMHSTAAQVRSVIGPDRWSSMTTFTIVRNPWDLMLSCYRYLTEYAPRQQDFLASLGAEVRALGDFNSFIRSPWGSERIMHLSAEIEDWYMIDGAQAVDEVFRIEDLSEEWPRFVARLKLPEALGELPHRGATSKVQDRHSAYDDDTRELIAKRFANLIERFEYTF